ncbi:MAG: tetratricopeptide repeat protein [Anaerolineales bacterium]
MFFGQQKDSGSSSDEAVNYNDRGNALADVGRYQEALANYARAIELDPGYSKAYSSRGTTYREMRRYVEALADYDRAIQLNLTYATAYYNRALTYGDLERYEEAISDLDQAIKIGLDSPANAYYARGKTHAHLEQYKEALDDLNQAIELNPNHAPAYSDRGYVLNRLGQYGNAEKDLKHAIGLDPDYGSAYINMAVSLRQLGKLREALPYLESASRLGDREIAAQASQMLRQAQQMLAKQPTGGLRGLFKRPGGGRARTKENRAQLPSRDSVGAGLHSLRPRDVPPGLRAFLEELPQWPPEQRQILEKMLTEAIDAGVTSWEELSSFLDTRPDLRADQLKSFLFGK